MTALRIIIHAGFHKTGTTALQHALSSARDKLLTKGILYPHTGCPDYAELGHHLLPWSVKRDQSEVPSFRGFTEQFDSARRQRLWSDLRKEISDSRAATVILSSEEFDTLNEAEIADLAGLLPAAARLHAVIGLKNHADFVEGMYRTSLDCHDLTLTMAEYLPLCRSRLDTCVMVTQWTQLCAGRITLLSYDLDDVRSDIAGTFFRALELDDSLLAARGTRVNSSYPAYVCEMVRHLRASGRPEAELVIFLNRISSASYRNPPRHNYVFLTPEQRAALNETYLAERTKLLDNDLFLQAFFPAPPPVSAARPPNAEDVVIGDFVKAALTLAAELMPEQSAPSATAATSDRAEGG